MEKSKFPKKIEVFEEILWKLKPKNSPKLKVSDSPFSCVAEKKAKKSLLYLHTTYTYVLSTKEPQLCNAARECKEPGNVFSLQYVHIYLFLSEPRLSNRWS